MNQVQLLVLVMLMQQMLFATVWLGGAWLRISKPAAVHWMASNGLTAAGMALILFRGVASPWLTVVCANVLIVLAVLALRRGVQVFARLAPTDAEHRRVATLSVAALTTAAALDAPMVVFMSGVSATLAWMFLRCAQEVWRALAAEFGEASARMCALPLAAVGSLYGVRALAGPLLNGAFAPSLSDAGPGNTGLMFSTILFGLVINGALMAMVFTRMVRRLEYSSDHDALTGLLGRRPLERVLRREDARRSRTGCPYALLSIDIDHFKRINDRHGHAAGDAVLVRVAQALRTHARQEDSVARMGGEEFCILLPGADQEGAQAAAQRLLQAVRRLHHPEVTPGLAVTVSIGVAAAGAEPVEVVLLRADRALYAAKQAGRDRVVAAEAGMAPVATMPCAPDCQTAPV